MTWRISSFFQFLGSFNGCTEVVRQGWGLYARRFLISLQSFRRRYLELNIVGAPKVAQRTPRVWWVYLYIRPILSTQLFLLSIGIRHSKFHEVLKVKHVVLLPSAKLQSDSSALVQNYIPILLGNNMRRKLNFAKEDTSNTEIITEWDVCICKSTIWQTMINLEIFKSLTFVQSQIVFATDSIKLAN